MKFKDEVKKILKLVLEDILVDFVTEEYKNSCLRLAALIISNSHKHKIEQLSDYYESRINKKIEKLKGQNMHREAIELCKTEIEELAEVNEFNEFDKAIISLQSSINTLKDIKLVAEGELNYINEGYTILCLGFKNKYKTSDVKLDKYMGKNIKIYIKGE